MPSVLGIGGVFVKSKDADALRAWYREMLGLEIQEWGGAQLWSTPGKTYGVWSAFRAESTYFEPSEREFMLNLRVDDLDGLLAKLRALGANVLDRREDSPDGKFGYVVDPDGTLLELWEAAPAA
jgi:predicted enzyme related to lactoylglutathione lyase